MKLVKTEKRNGRNFYTYQIAHSPDGPGRLFEVGYVSSAKELNCTMLPEFRRHWWAQHLASGDDTIAYTKKGVLDWIAEWEEIGCPGQPECSGAPSHTVQAKNVA